MFCYRCDKFIKKGHGKNVYYYAREWRYYCFFCLRWNYCSWRIAQRRKKYFWWVTIPTLILSSFVWQLTSTQIEKIGEKGMDEYFWLCWVFAILPIIGAVIVWYLIIRPNLEEKDEEDWRPILEQQDRLEKMENYVYYLKKDKEFCHCENCLVAEYNKGK